MNKRDFFIAAMHAGRFADKAWLIAAFSVVLPRTNIFDGMKPYDIIYGRVSENGVDRDDVYFIDDQGNSIRLDDYEYQPNNPTPVYRFKDRLNIGSSEMVNLSKPTIETTYGNVLANWLLCVYPFNNKIPYFEGKFGIKDVEKHIEKRLTTNPDDPSERNTTALYVDEYTKYRRAASMIDGLTQLAVPSATAKTMTRHPDTEKVRAALLEKYKDKLDDPNTIVKIESELKALDLEWLKDDEAMNFYIKKKSLDVVRTKMFLTGGLVQSFTDEGNQATLIPSSLSEGMDVSKLPAMVNNLREGSYDRGASTALGGESVKFILRVMQNAVIEEEDCKTKNTLPSLITKANRDQYLLNYILDQGKLIQLTDENIDRYVDKTVNLRTAAFCKSPHSGYCSVCIGGRYGSHKHGLATAASTVGSIFMGVFMASMHGTSLSVAKYNYKTSLS